jgi:hypothetical protein
VDIIPQFCGKEGKNSALFFKVLARNFAGFLKSEMSVFRYGKFSVGK